MNTNLKKTIRGWVEDGCPAATLYRDGAESFYVSAHPGGLGGCEIVDLKEDEWGDVPPTSYGDADWITEQIVSHIL